MKTRNTVLRTKHCQAAAAPGERDPARTAQAAATGRHAELQAAIDQSPRMLAQRAVHAAFGSTFQRPADGRDLDATAPVVQKPQAGDAGELPPQRRSEVPGPSPASSDASLAPVNVVQRYIELGRPDNPSPAENELEPEGQIRYRDGAFAEFDRELWNRGIACRAYHYERYFGFEENDPEQAGGWLNIQRWLAEDMSCELHDALAVEAVKYTMELTRLPLENLRATTSGGSALTILPEGRDFVVQYLRPGAFASLKQMHAALKDASSEVLSHVAEIRSLDEGRQLAVVEKVRPLNTIFDFFGGNGNLRSNEDLKAFVQQNAAKLKHDGLSAVNGLAARGVSQGDVSFDNMGIKNGRFALFDYDKTEPAEADSVARDTRNLGKSFQSRGGIDMSKVDAGDAGSEITGL